MPIDRKFRLPTMTAVLILAVGACESTPSVPEVDLLTSVQQATLRFQNSAEAVAQGYVPDAHCVAHPELGGMGFHWVNQNLVDPAFEPLKPEALLYAPVAGGGERLIGVEYIVIDTGQPRPDFDGQPFDEGGVPPLMEAGVPHWSLHVWIYEQNPSGMFAPFNPRVTCG